MRQIDTSTLKKMPTLTRAGVQRRQLPVVTAAAPAFPEFVPRVLRQPWEATLQGLGNLGTASTIDGRECPPDGSWEAYCACMFEPGTPGRSACDSSWPFAPWTIFGKATGSTLGKKVVGAAKNVAAKGADALINVGAKGAEDIINSGGGSGGGDQGLPDGSGGKGGGGDGGTSFATIGLIALGVAAVGGGAIYMLTRRSSPVPAAALRGLRNKRRNSRKGRR